MLWRPEPPQGTVNQRAPAPGQPYALQPRPMGHGHSLRYEHLASHEAPPPQSHEQVPGELAQWRSGEQRLSLRRHFNSKELDVVDIVQRYDLDHSRVLEPPELRRLLQDYNGGRPPKDEELRFILKIADRDHDQRISQEEVMFALRTWYAFNHMPSSVGHAFAKYGFCGGAMPSSESFRLLLLSLNEHQPVEDDEVAFVRAMAVRLSGSEERVALEHLRQAVATWYLNIERGETSHVDLLGKAAADAHKRIFDMTQITLLFKGECDYNARGTLGLGVVMLVVLVIFPCLEILISDLFPTDWRCQHPHLSTMLWATGVLGLTLFLGIAGAIAATHYKLGSVKVFMWVFVVTISAIVCVVTIMGAQNVLWSSAGRCGIAIWHFAHLMWIEIPVLMILFLFCGLPIMYGAAGSQEFIKNHQLDQGLMKP